MRNIYTDWVIPCNLNYFDLFGAFAQLSFIDWRQVANNIEEGDTVYIYAGRPVKAIVFKCRVMKTNIPLEEIEDSDRPFNQEENPEPDKPYWRYMRLKPVGRFEEDQITLRKLHEAGMKGNIQGQRRVDACMLEVIRSARLLNV